MTKAEREAIEALVEWCKLDRKILTSKRVLGDDAFEDLMVAEERMRRAGWALPKRWVDDEPEKTDDYKKARGVIKGTLPAEEAIRRIRG